MQNRLYFENLSPAATKAAVVELFASFGKVIAVTLESDPRTGELQGYGFVELSTEEEARKAIGELNGSLYDGRRLTVTLASPTQRRSTGFRGGMNRGERKNR